MASYLSDAKITLLQPGTLVHVWDNDRLAFKPTSIDNDKLDRADQKMLSVNV